jgi:hypothetical protein
LGQDGSAREHIDPAVAADRGRKLVIGGRVIEIDRARASAKFNALREERAGRNRGIARARADVERSNRTGFRRDYNRPVDVDNAAVRNRERARAKVADVHPRTVAPHGARAPVTVTVPREPAPLPMLAAKPVSLMTVPPFAIVSVPVPKLPMLSPPPGLLRPDGAHAGHRHRTSRAGRQSDGAATPTVHHAAVFDGQRARAQSADLDGVGIRPRGACAGYGHRALRAR